MELRRTAQKGKEAGLAKLLIHMDIKGLPPGDKADASHGCHDTLRDRPRRRANVSKYGRLADPKA
jgi:hypothetical protein